tara:strand:+ start:6721 stop:7137 length:417 start_codon:yes stop_codon:yes gene_type:complete
MTAFDTAWNLLKMSSGHFRFFSEKEKQGIAELNRHLVSMSGEELDPDPSVNFPSECSECFSEINNLVEGIPNHCSRCIHPFVDKRINDAMETQGLFGDGKPFNLEDAIRQDETLIDPFDGTASSIDFPEYERRMRDLE